MTTTTKDGNEHGAFRWIAGVLAGVLTVIVLSAGSFIINHETRLTRVETQVDIHLEDIRDTLQSIDAKLP